MQAHISASPSSTMTTPSPTFPFRRPSELPDTIDIEDLDPQEREERQKAVQKFLERAEFSKLTRGLRARLSYASYKATHNLSHLPLPVLEDRIQTPSPAPSPTPTPAPTPPSPSKRRGGPPTTTMPPPVSPSPSLYSALLGPPPQKRPRHIYGPALTSSLSSSSIPSSQSPTPADLLSTYSATPAHPPSTPRSKARAGSGAVSSSNPTGGAGAAPSSPFSSATGRTVRNAMQGRARNTLTEKEDMNAAATLTALMFTTRASPRQQHQSPARFQPGPSPQRGGGGLNIIRATTPISNTKSSEDADAAELMLFLATSPSPARPTTNNMPRRTPTSMGRILFAGEDTAASGSAGVAASGFTSSPTNGRSPLHDRSMEMEIDKFDIRGGAGTPDLTFSQSSQESTSSLLAPPPPLRSPALSHASQTKSSSSFGASRKLFIDGEDTRRIMGMATGTYSSSSSTLSSPPQNNSGSGTVNGSKKTASSGFTLGKSIDLVEAK